MDKEKETKAQKATKLGFVFNGISAITDLAAVILKEDKDYQAAKAAEEKAELDAIYSNDLAVSLMNTIADKALVNVAHKQTESLRVEAAKAVREAAEKTKAAKTKAQKAKAAEDTKAAKAAEEKAKAAEETALSYLRLVVAKTKRFYNYDNKKFVALKTEQMALSWGYSVFNEYVRTRSEVKAKRQVSNTTEKIAEKVKAYVKVMSVEDLTAFCISTIKGATKELVQTEIAKAAKAAEETKETEKAK